MKKELLKNPWLFFFLVCSIGIIVIIPVLSLKSGNSGDEDTWQYPYAEKVYKFYSSGGKDTTYKDVPEMNPYGMWYETTTVAICKILKADDYHRVRHIINSLMGCLAIFFSALLARRIGGWRAAVFVLFLFSLSPRFVGHSFNNPKDVPFAAMFAISLFFICKFIQEYPRFKISTAVFLAISIGLAMGIRVGGLLLYAFLGFFVVLYYCTANKVSEYFTKDNLKIVGRTSLIFIGIIVVSFVVSFVFWPYLLESPIKHTIEIFNTMSQYSVSLRQLFEGTMQWSDYLPWYYTPKYILITIPIAVILGVILFFVFCWRKKEDRFWAFFLFFTFFFPVFWIVFTKANVYGGWRHAMFAYPPMVAAAGWGFDALVKWVEAKLGIKNGELRMENDDANDGGDGARPVSTKGIIINVGSVVILLALLIGPIRHIVANHPYEYVYFNELAGGTKKALGQYELDYYYHSTRAASEWVIANAEPKADGSKIRVGTWHTASVNYFFRHDTARFQPTFIRWYEKENTDWDYAIFTVTGIAPEYLRSPYFPPKNTVKTIDVDGVPICIVLKRQDKNDFLAAQMKNDNTKLDSAIALYQQALAVDPDNIGALLGIGECYVRTNRPDSALLYLDRYHKIDPEAEMANYMRAYAYVYKQDLKTALDILHGIEEQNPKYAGAYQLAIQLYLQQKDFVNAKKQFVKVMDVDRFDDSFVQLWLQYNQMQNIDQNTAYRQLYKSMAKSFEKRGKKEEAARFRELAGIKSK